MASFLLFLSVLFVTSIYVVIGIEERKKRKRRMERTREIIEESWKRIQERQGNE